MAGEGFQAAEQCRGGLKLMIFNLSRGRGGGGGGLRPGRLPRSG